MKFRFLALAVLVGWTGLAEAASPESLATVVIYNAADPSSTALAKYYAKRREIPTDRLLGLYTPATEEISRAEYVATIAQPVKEAFVRNGWWTLKRSRVDQTKIRFVALIRGMPLKIRSIGEGVVPTAGQPPAIGGRDESSVDSELACLGLGDLPTAGVVPNPYYRRFTPILNTGSDPGLLLVSRLDAPTEITVRVMIDDAVMAERDGLWGWAYADTRSISDKGYIEGDQWIGNAAKQMREKGIPVLWDKAPATLAEGYPVTDAAVYLGWYAGTVNGPFADPGFRFRPGAIAVHIHSFSAATLRSATSGWCGPLVERGAAVTLGNVYEPYLSLTANLDVFQERLMAGFTFAESAYGSQRALSWMGVAIGDPIYKPYAAWREFDHSGKSTWQQYRSIVLGADQDVLKAADQLKAAAKSTGSSMFLESLAAVQADANDLPGALANLDLALSMKNKPLVRFRLVLERLGILMASGKKEEAKKVLLTEKGRAPGPAQAALVDRLMLGMFPPPTPTQPSTEAP